MQNEKLLKIGFCGAHGTGKTTILEILSQKLDIYPIQRTLRTLWESFGVVDFEKLPPDARAVLQKFMILKQIEREDQEGQNGFISDRTVLDMLGYTLLNSNMHGVVLSVYEELVRARLKNYTHFVYFPIEFEVENEHLRANVQSRQQIADILEKYLEKWFKPEQYLRVTGTVEGRVKQISEFLQG